MAGSKKIVCVIGDFASFICWLYIFSFRVIVLMPPPPQRKGFVGVQEQFELQGFHYRPGLDMFEGFCFLIEVGPMKILFEMEELVHPFLVWRRNNAVAFLFRIERNLTKFVAIGLVLVF